MVMPLVAEPLGDVRPVLLLHGRVVVLLVWPAAGELHRLFPLLAPVEQVLVDEFAPVVAVQPQEREGQSGFDVLEPFERVGLAAISDRARLHPGGADVDRVELPDQIPVEPLPHNATLSIAR